MEIDAKTKLQIEILSYTWMDELVICFSTKIKLLPDASAILLHILLLAKQNIKQNDLIKKEIKQTFKLTLTTKVFPWLWMKNSVIWVLTNSFIIFVVIIS